jgi:phosphate:Na+ symporter
VILIAGTLLGGLGIFLLAISMITDGLKLAAGGQLKAILERWTTTRLRGVASGVLVTAIVQSSSAVTVATIGFVNAGLLSLGQALGVIYGANVGTTMTGWVVAAVGFSFRIETLALPMIGIGMFVRLVRPRSRLADLGVAVAGFGLFFIGIDVMQGAFEDFAAGLDLARLGPGGFGSLILYVLLGILMTVLTQSSSAAIAITLTAATGGVLSIEAAAATVIGANVGTTSTAALAVIGATANARRVAAAHVVFNAVTGLAALLLLPLMLWFVRVTGDLLGLEDAPAVILALFHTSFNLLGVVLMWPWTTRLTRYLYGKFTTQAELLSRPQYLDANVLEAPALALEALNLELVRTLAMTRDVISRALGPVAEGQRLEEQRHGVAALCDEIAEFVTRVDAGRLPNELKGRTPQALRIVAYIEEIMGLLDDRDASSADIRAIAHSSIAAAIDRYQRHVVRHVLLCDSASEEVASGGIDTRYLALRQDWRSLKNELLEAASRGDIPVHRLNLALEGLRGTLRIAEQLGKAAARLRALQQAGAPETAPARSSAAGAG